MTRFSTPVACALLLSTAAHAHIVSTSTGDLRITGRTATYELRIPHYEVESIPPAETALLNEIRFGGAKRTSSQCADDGSWYVCHATYEFDHDVTNAIDVDCTLYRATVPNHIHYLYAANGPNSDQKVFDQNTTTAEMRFHPPSFWESVRRDTTTGALRLFRSVSALLFLAAIALVARSPRDAAALAVAFFAAQWAVRPIAPFIPLALSVEFLEALLALTSAYLAGELLFLASPRAANAENTLPAMPRWNTWSTMPKWSRDHEGADKANAPGRARWIVVPLFGLLHGLPFTAFPPLYLTGAIAVEIPILAALAFAALRMPAQLRRPAAGTLLAVSVLWFGFRVFGPK